MNDKIVSLKKEKTFPTEQELHNRIVDIMEEYHGDISLVAVVGILDLIKFDLLSNAITEDE